MGLGLCKLSKKTNLSVAVKGKSHDGNHTDLYSSKIDIREFKFIGELHDHLVVRPQALIDKVECKPGCAPAELSIRHVLAVTG